MFLEFADEEREHFDLLVREFRALVAREKLKKTEKVSKTTKKAKAAGHSRRA